MKLFGRKKNSKDKYSFHEQLAPVSNKLLSNPGIGWYQIYTLKVEEVPNFEELRWCIGNRLVLVIFHIGSYREKDLDQSALFHMESVLSYLEKMHRDIILRVVYDNEGKGLKNEPMQFSRVLAHMDQVGPLLTKYADAIYLYQGMFVGSWGEMHSSKYLGNERLKEMENKLREYLPQENLMAVRRPMYYRRLYREAKAEPRIGFYDDAILSSETHMGTFGNDSYELAGWKNSWKREDELNFLAELCKKVPYGGEALMGEQGFAQRDAKKTVQELENLQVSYLNQTYDPKVIREWGDIRWREKDLWKGCTLKEYIGAHLGYRFQVSGVRAKKGPVSEEEEEQLLISFTITNDGFSSLYEKAYLFVEQRIISSHNVNKRMKKRTMLPIDLRDLAPGQSMIVEQLIALQMGKVYLGAERIKDSAVIHFANESSEDVLLIGTVV